MTVRLLLVDRDNVTGVLDRRMRAAKHLIQRLWDHRHRICRQGAHRGAWVGMTVGCSQQLLAGGRTGNVYHGVVHSISLGTTT